ncbi:MAG: GNAT family N-acetyltransferase [Firmicutes bacterium]|nr:GNAT family N-acetyltransferase [Bacillota bacterium]
MAKVNTIMPYSVSEESFTSLISLYKKTSNSLKWEPLFILPPWLKVWWQEFGSCYELLLLSVRKGEEVIGLAPLKKKDDTASLIGSSDVTDYVDFIVSPGREEIFFELILTGLQKKGIKYLELKHFRPESAIANYMVKAAREKGLLLSLEPEEKSLEISLPDSWEAYLALLSKKQRHEVRRKIRNLKKAGQINFRLLSGRDELAGWTDSFFRLFRESRQDKASYMTPKREAFFRSMLETMAEWNLLKMGVLEFEAEPAALTLMFDYQHRILLYNSGYNPRLRHLSAGLVSKLLCIKDSIKKNRKVFDFLKGDEAYKYRLGGKEVPLYRCLLSL